MSDSVTVAVTPEEGTPEAAAEEGGAETRWNSLTCAAESS